MTAIMTAKIAAARDMLATAAADGLLYRDMYFSGVFYEDLRRDYDADTPTLATMRKYGAIRKVPVDMVWTSDGSLLAALSGLRDGQTITVDMFTLA